MKPVFRARVTVELHNALQDRFGKSDKLLGIKIGTVAVAEPVGHTTCSWALPNLTAPDRYRADVLQVVEDVRRAFPRIIRPPGK